MKFVQVWMSGNKVIVSIKNRPCHTLGLEYLPRIVKLLDKAWRSDKYTFRPFLGGSFGIVAMEELECKLK